VNIKTLAKSAVYFHKFTSVIVSNGFCYCVGANPLPAEVTTRLPRCFAF
jgi:hypothetical protein